MHLWTIAGKNLWRRPARSALTVSGLAIAVAAVVALVGVSDSLESSYLDLYTRPGSDLVVQRRGGQVQLAKGLDLAFGDQIRQIPGVKDIVCGLVDLVAFEDHDLFMVMVNGYEPECMVFKRVKILSGRVLREGDGRDVMLGRILAANLGKKAGDQVSIYGEDFEVVGVFESFSVYENGAVFMVVDELQRQMDRPGEVTGIVVLTETRKPKDIARIGREIEALRPDVSATTCADFVSNLSQMKIVKTVSWFTSLFAVVIGGVGMMNTMAMSVLERRGEIASLRAMGWRQGRVAKLILSESLVLSVVGAVLGVAIGLGAIWLLTQWRRTSGLVQGDLSLPAISEGFLVALAIALIGAALPAIRCARLPIAETLRAG